MYVCRLINDRPSAHMRIHRHAHTGTHLHCFHYVFSFIQKQINGYHSIEICTQWQEAVGIIANETICNHNVRGLPLNERLTVLLFDEFIFEFSSHASIHTHAFTYTSAHNIFTYMCYTVLYHVA